MNDGWCLECGEEFHLDDTGGYNPPCPCGCGCCRHCCPRENVNHPDWEPEAEVGERSKESPK